MTSGKRILRNDGVRHFVCALAARYIRLVHATGRWTVSNAEVPRRHWREGRPFILCFWHGRLLMMPYAWDREVPIHMLISQHPDGRLIADTVRHFGIDTVAGSSRKGGSAALRTMVKMLAGGDCVGITPDGPRGPRMRASAGIVSVARLSGAPIIPATFAATRRRVLGSWDRFVLALPFGRGAFLWGEPVRVARDADAAAQEAARQAVEDRLNELTREADRLCGHAPVEPAPEPTEAVPMRAAGGA